MPLDKNRLQEGAARAAAARSRSDRGEKSRERTPSVTYHQEKTGTSRASSSRYDDSHSVEHRTQTRYERWGEDGRNSWLEQERRAERQRRERDRWERSGGAPVRFNDTSHFRDPFAGNRWENRVDRPRRNARALALIFIILVIILIIFVVMMSYWMVRTRLAG